MPLPPPGLFDAAFAAAFVATFITGVMRGFAGFGAGMALIPVYSLLWGPVVGVPVLILIEIPATLQLLPRAWKAIDWRAALLLGIPAVIGARFGAELLVELPADLMRQATAVLVVIAVIALWFGWRYRGRRPAPLTAGVGATTGLLAGATGIGGPPVILYQLAADGPVERHRATLIGFYVPLEAALVTFYLLFGLFTPQVLWLGVLLALPFMAGIVFGQHLFGRADENAFRRVTLLFLGAVAIYALVA
ncbi:MAG: sulfite exporter TauE/SafE family protein [Alphaproteobacteria bacterium]|nr:sulfite exporter TauE/SafE family protein [Alphaproteobacteria bacterium]